jgi:SAM-dependent methyltransferase
VNQLLNRLFFNLWYLQKPPWDTGVSPPELVEFIHTHSPGRALDIGCGTGTNVITLAKHGWRVVGVDFANLAIRNARQKVKRAGVEAVLQVGDATQLSDLATKFDLILDIGCFHSLTENQRAVYVKTVPQLLATEGTFLLYAFFKSIGDSGPGLLPADVSLLSQNVTLVQRLDGSERGLRQSAWFTFQPCNSSSYS